MRTFLTLWLILAPALPHIKEAPPVHIQAAMQVSTRETPPVPLKGKAHLVGAYMGAPNDQNTVVVGKTFQLHIVGVFSDGSIQDPVDNKYVVWGATPNQFITITQTGIVTGVSPGVSNATAHMNAVGMDKWVFSNWWTITVLAKEYNGKYTYDDDQ